MRVYILYTLVFPVSPGNWLKDPPPPGTDTKIHLMLYTDKMA